MQSQSVGGGSALRTQGSSLYPSGFGDVNFTGATAVGGRCCDDVLRGGLLIVRLLLQMFHVGLGRVLRDSLFGLQLGLTLRDNVVCLQHRDGNVVTTTDTHPFIP